MVHVCEYTGSTDLAGCFENLSNYRHYLFEFPLEFPKVYLFNVERGDK